MILPLTLCVLPASRPGRESRPRFRASWVEAQSRTCWKFDVTAAGLRRLGTRSLGFFGLDLHKVFNDSSHVATPFPAPPRGYDPVPTLPVFDGPDTRAIWRITPST